MPSQGRLSRTPPTGYLAASADARSHLEHPNVKIRTGAARRPIVAATAAVVATAGVAAVSVRPPAVKLRLRSRARADGRGPAAGSRRNTVRGEVLSGTPVTAAPPAHRPLRTSSGPPATMPARPAGWGGRLWRCPGTSAADTPARSMASSPCVPTDALGSRSSIGASATGARPTSASPTCRTRPGRSSAIGPDAGLIDVRLVLDAEAAQDR